MHGFEHGLFQSVRGLVHHQKHLLPIGKGCGCHQTPTHGELLAPSQRQLRSAGRSDDTGGFSELLFPVPDRAHGEIEVTVEAAAGAPLPLYSVWLLGAP